MKTKEQTVQEIKAVLIQAFLDAGIIIYPKIK